MGEEQSRKLPAVHLGSIEPLAGRLDIPSNGQLLYKTMKVENLLLSIAESYLHFNRVDSYLDFPGADQHDGRQLPTDLLGNAMAKFEKAPNFSMALYYDQSRSRTYACSLSLENSASIWKYGKVCVVFDFAKLRAMLNHTLQPGHAALSYRGNRCHQIFSINYGIVKYVEWEQYQANARYFPNPIEYTYLKDKEKFFQEKELRICLSALGMGQFTLNDGCAMEFPASLRMTFDFRAAMTDGTIRKILYAPACDRASLYTELRKQRIEPME